MSGFDIFCIVHNVYYTYGVSTERKGVSGVNLGHIFWCMERLYERVSRGVVDFMGGSSWVYQCMGGMSVFRLHPSTLCNPIHCIVYTMYTPYSLLYRQARPYPSSAWFLSSLLYPQDVNSWLNSYHSQDDQTIIFDNYDISIHNIYTKRTKMARSAICKGLLHSKF